MSIIRRRNLHYIERPVANLAALQYNTKRGKKQKALGMLDFCLYASAEDLNLPNEHFGAAMLKAIEERIWPSWALFVFPQLRDVANGPAPETYLAMANDILVLAPQVDGSVLKGLVIAQESASEKVRQLVTNDGIIYTVRLPKVPTKFVAEETWELDLLEVNQAGPG